ncbi:hypothetical protein EV126DRAFT_413459 [Verticillium dahliae]|nr:hypothetical protein EV126DRAFT_413459 [Verticillium dahliae]
MGRPRPGQIPPPPPAPAQPSNVSHAAVASNSSVSTSLVQGTYTTALVRNGGSRTAQHVIPEFGDVTGSLFAPITCDALCFSNASLHSIHIGGVLISRAFVSFALPGDAGRRGGPRATPSNSVPGQRRMEVLKGQAWLHPSLPHPHRIFAAKGKNLSPSSLLTGCVCRTLACFRAHAGGGAEKQGETGLLPLQDFWPGLSHMVMKGRPLGLQRGWRGPPLAYHAQRDMAAVRPGTFWVCFNYFFWRASARKKMDCGTPCWSWRTCLLGRSAGDQGASDRPDRCPKLQYQK